MKYAVWTVQVLLALMFAGVGVSKLTTPREQLVANPMMAWANDFSGAQIKAIGAAEVAGALGLVLPAATGILPVLTPTAAAGLTLLMGGAVVTHAGRGEPFVFPLMLALLSALVAAARFRIAGTSRGAPSRV